MISRLVQTTVQPSLAWCASYVYTCAPTHYSILQSVFLAVVQIIFIQFTAGTPNAFPGTRSIVNNATNFFSFSALILDTLGSLLTARDLLRAVNTADSIIESKALLTTVVHNILNNIEGSHRDPLESDSKRTS